MGAILYMLVFGKVPPEKNSKSLIVEAIKKSNIKLEDSGWHNNLKSFIQLLMAMLAANPQERISA